MYKMIFRRYVMIGVMVLMIFVAANQGQRQKKRKNKVKVELDPATARILKMLRNQKGVIHTRNVRTTVAPSYPSSRLLIQDYINMKFKSEIVRLFTYLPHKQRCKTVNNIMNTTRCDNAFISDTLAQANIVRDFTSTRCFRVRSYRCSKTKNAANVLREFWKQMGTLFQGLPVPFQCSIVNKISSSSPTSKRRRLRQSHVLKGKTPRITLQMVEKQLEKVYPTLNITQKCSKVWKPLKKKVPLKSPASLVNVTVELTAGVRRKVWVKRLRRRAYKIYKIYYKHSMKEQRHRPLSFLGGRQSTDPPLLAKKDVRLIIIRMTKVSQYGVSVVFSLEYKKSATSPFVKVSPAKQIIKAINATGTVAMQRLFNARVLELTVAKDDPGHVDAIWTSEDMAKAYRLFPRHLVSYYRLGIDRLARCLVMLYISSNLQRDLRPVELYYNSHKYLPKKYFCSSTRRTTVTNVSVGSFYRINDTDNNPFSPKPKPRGNKPTDKVSLIDRINERMNVSYALGTTEPKLSTIDEDEDEDGPIGERSSTKTMTPLEMGLIAVLTVLCIAILSFTIYCIVFAIRKRKPPPTDQKQGETAFELFKRIEEAKQFEQNMRKRENEEIKLNSNADRLGVLMEEVRKPESQSAGSNQNVYSIDPLHTNQQDRQGYSSSETDQEVPSTTIDCSGLDVEDDSKGAGRNDRNAHPHCVDDADDGDEDDGDDNNDDDDKDINQSQVNDNNSIANGDDGSVRDSGQINHSDEDVFDIQTSPENTNSEEDLTDYSPSQRNCPSNHDRPARTLKESCGEMRIISDNNDVSKRSLSISSEIDPVIKNNIMKVVVVIDGMDIERESST